MNKHKISIIVATDDKRGIGRGNELMWKIPEELKRFKEITTGHPIIMGRKTHESIGRILPNRTNIIVTRDNEYRVEGAKVVHSLEAAIELAKNEEGSEEVFIIGGGQIYEQSLGEADKLYLTRVEGDFSADTFFPDYSNFKQTKKDGPHESNGHTYTFYEYEKAV